MSRALRRLILTWGALVLPLFVCAHNGEFLLAKLTLRTDGECALKVTADLEANFNIRDGADLMKAAPGLFLVSTDGDTRLMSSLVSSISFSSATKLDADSPFQHTAEELAKEYRLESAEWTWTPEPRNFVLRLPEGSPHTVLLWLVDEKQPSAKPRWVMMIAGDESPLIQAHAPTPTLIRSGWEYRLGGRLFVILAALAALGAAGWVARKLIR